MEWPVSKLFQPVLAVDNPTVLEEAKQSPTRMETDDDLRTQLEDMTCDV
jgi:hypothetical protein